MKLTAKDLKDLEVIDKIIKEPKENTLDSVAKSLKKEIILSIKEMKTKKPEDIKEERYNKFRNMGKYKRIGENDNVKK